MAEYAEIRTDIKELNTKIDNLTSKVDALYGGVAVVKWVFGGLIIPITAITIKYLFFS